MCSSVVYGGVCVCVCVCVFDAVLETLCLAVFKSSNAQVKVESASSTCPVCGFISLKEKQMIPCKALNNNKKHWLLLVVLKW